MSHTARQEDMRPQDFRLKDSDVCSDRLDSGIDSMYSLEDSMRSSSIRKLDMDAISERFSSVTLSKPADEPTVQSLRFDDKAGLENDDWCDSGLGCSDEGYRSFKESLSLKEENNNLEEEKTIPVSEEIARFFVPDKEGDTYLQLAIIHGKTDLAFNIIQMCTVPELLDVANSEQQTALHLAVLTDQPKLTRCLVAYGANVRCKDKFGNTPLHIACEHGMASHVDMLTSKLDSQEDPGFQRYVLPQNVNERNYLGFAPLHLAVCNNQLHIVRYLIHVLKCDINLADLKSGRTALHYAIERRNAEAARLILSERADVNALTYDEYAPLHFAAARGFKTEANSLLKHGADIFLITRDDCDVFELSVHNPRLHSMLKTEAAARRHRLAHSGLQP